MAITGIVYRCGCPFKTTSIEEAEKHCDRENHTMFSQGEIKPGTGPKKA